MNRSTALRALSCLAINLTIGLSLAAPAAIEAQSQQAIELRNLGLAQLENERYEDAEAAFHRLMESAPNDPIGQANLAVSLLRQQKNDEALSQIDDALEKFPSRADLLAIRGQILAWQGKLEEALAAFERAVENDPNTLDYVYLLFDQATTLGTEESQEIAERALAQLARLAPNNLVVLRQLGEKALRDGDREVASRTYLRIGELLSEDQAVKNILQRVYDPLMAALEEDDLAKARRPALLLGNAVVSSSLYKPNLVELFVGLEGIPVPHFVDEPPVSSFGDPIDTSFRASQLATSASRGSIVAADLDGDDEVDIARLVGEGVEIRLSRAQSAPTTIAAAGAQDLMTFDLENDGDLDLVASGQATSLWLNDGKANFSDATADFGLTGVGATTATVLDYDSDGDLDLVVARRGEHVDLFLNNMTGPLVAIGSTSMPPLLPRTVVRLLARDLDRDGDRDLLVAHEGGVTWLDNQRQGTFSNRTAPGGLRQIAATVDLASADFDHDGQPDLAVLGTELTLLRGSKRGFTPSDLTLDAQTLDGLGTLHAVLAFDADNDGRMDLAVAGDRGVAVLARRDDRFDALEIEGAVEDKAFSSLAAVDIDRDGDLDLIASGTAGLYRFDNGSGNQNCWLDVSLRGLTKGNDKNNFFGFGAESEVRVGTAYQFQEVTSPVTHFGVGSQKKLDFLRVVWNNGVPQNNLQPKVQCKGEATALPIVEEQVLKGSCPFLYTWDGEQIRFVTDLLWGAPLGMPLARGVWNGFDPEELVRVDGLEARDGAFDLRLTEELWEAAYFDRVRLWAVDTPEDLDVSSNLRIVPGSGPDDPVNSDRVLATADLRPVVAARDGRGRDVTGRIERRDEVYADGYERSDYQGIAARPWSFTFDLGEAPNGPVRLLLDGWIFPSDASLNIASSQRSDLDFTLTRLEVETDDGWQVLMDPMGFPAGKTKTTVVDTPALPRGAHRLRIVTSRWLHWDRIVWSTQPRDDLVVVAARLEPSTAELRYRGFSKLLRQAPNAPHTYDYSLVEEQSPWLPLSGRATRYGDVRELLETVDDRLVVLAPGDEIRVLFDAATLPPLAPGNKRTYFLESHGYDKDADRNTWAGDSVEPLPFQGMESYPFPEGVSYPDDERHRRYLEKWQTRELGGQSSGAPSTGGGN